MPTAVIDWFEFDNPDVDLGETVLGHDFGDPNLEIIKMGAVRTIWAGDDGVVTGGAFYPFVNLKRVAGEATDDLRHGTFAVDLLIGERRIDGASHSLSNRGPSGSITQSIGAFASTLANSARRQPGTTVFNRVGDNDRRFPGLIPQPQPGLRVPLGDIDNPWYPMRSVTHLGNDAATVDGIRIVFTPSSAS